MIINLKIKMYNRKRIILDRRRSLIELSELKKIKDIRDGVFNNKNNEYEGI